MRKPILMIIFFAIGIILLAILAFGPRARTSDNTPVNANNVHMENGVQIVELRARGGYQPQNSIATAGIPTILRMQTDGTFDCSASVRIPSLNYLKILPQNGVENIDLGTPKKGVLQGMCGMGMYPFSIAFQ